MEKWYNNQYVLWWFSEIFTNRKCTSKSWNPSFSLFSLLFVFFFFCFLYTPTTMVIRPTREPFKLSLSMKYYIRSRLNSWAGLGQQAHHKNSFSFLTTYLSAHGPQAEDSSRQDYYHYTAGLKQKKYITWQMFFFARIDGFSGSRTALWAPSVRYRYNCIEWKVAECSGLDSDSWRINVGVVGSIPTFAIRPQTIHFIFPKYTQWYPQLQVYSGAVRTRNTSVGLCSSKQF